MVGDCVSGALEMVGHDSLGGLTVTAFDGVDKDTMLLEMLVESFRGPILMSLMEAREVAPEMGGLGTKEHERFIEAVRRRDCDDAGRIMGEHLARTAGRLRHDH